MIALSTTAFSGDPCETFNLYRRFTQRGPFRLWKRGAEAGGCASYFDQSVARAKRDARSSYEPRTTNGRC